MRTIIENKKYIENLKEYSSFNINWDSLKDKVIMLSGATGLIGQYFIDLIMYKNINEGLNCKIVALCRNKNKGEDIYSNYLQFDTFEIIEQDVKEAINYNKSVDFIIHAASNTYPIQYAKDPIGTLTTNIFGTYNLLKWGENNKIKKFIFVSSFEVYGQVDKKSEIYEKDFGVVDCTVLRSCYPESKRASESLCEAFSEQLGMDISIVRLSRVFGPTMNMESSLATAQFFLKGLNGEDIVLKSDGSQLYSYNYVGDAVTSILVVLLNGQDKEAYNVASNNFDAKLKEFAECVANCVGRKVIFDLPDEIEKKGFSNSVMTILNSDKIKAIGWKAEKNLSERIKETIDILKEL